MTEKPANKWAEKWAAFSGRERVLLSGLAIMLLIAILWYGTTQPLMQAQQAADTRLEAATDQRLAVLAAKAARAEPVAGELSPQDVLALAEADGVTATIVGGDGSNIEFRIDAVRADIAFAWMAKLEQQHSARINTANVTRNEAGAVVRVAMTITP